MARKLTDPFVRELKPDPVKRLELGDLQADGLKLVVQPSGAKSWAYRFRLGGKPQKFTIGPFGEAEDGRLPAGVYDVAAARAAAREAHDQVRKGKHPMIAQREALAAQRIEEAGTVDAALEQFFTEYVDEHQRLSSARITKPALRMLVQPWRGRRLKDITRADLKTAIALAGKRGPAAAVKARMVVSRFFNWAVEEDLIESSPAARLGKMKARPARERVLDDAEIVRLWLACDRVDAAWLGTYVRLLLLTAQRRGEVIGLRWSEIKGDDWIIPAERNKGKRAHLVPLTPAVRGLLDSVVRVGDTFAFSSNGRGPRGSYGKAKLTIDRAIEADGDGPMDHWTFHDLRRTAASGMAELGTPEPDVERVLNHARSQLVETYQRYNGKAEKAKALRLWEDHVLGLVARATGGNVVALTA